MIKNGNYHQNCGFCRPGIEKVALWESENYRVMADEYPKCVGHVLLLTKEHYLSHMHAPAEWMTEFEAAQKRVRQFLLDTFGKAAFFENGGKRQDVYHAHLHGLPLNLALPEEWVEKERLLPIGTWQEARQECEKYGYYFYIESMDGHYLIRESDYDLVVNHLQDQLAGQTEAYIDEETSGGPEVVARTVKLWQRWSAAGR